jgi:hypothetical protein
VASKASSATEELAVSPRLPSFGDSDRRSDATTPLSVRERRLLIWRPPPPESILACTVPADKTGPVALVPA